VLRAVHRLVEGCPKVHGADPRGGPRVATVSVRCVSRKASVPSPPTRICARLMSFLPGIRSVEIVTADATLHFRKALSDFSRLTLADDEKVARKFAAAPARHR